MAKNDWLKETVKENARHIGVLNSELGDVKLDIRGIKTDLRWVKWILLPILGGVVSLVFKVFLGS